MRGARCWAVAARRPSGEIYVERHPTSDLQTRRPIWAKPMFRGNFALVDALKIGFRAMSISTNQQLEEEEQLSAKQMGGTIVFALFLFIGVFIALPNFGLQLLSEQIGNGVVYHLVEGVVRIGILIGYLLAMSLVSDIRRVFAYHGAEHKTIAAWEHNEPLEPRLIDRYSTLHVRCGTNFLIMTMLIAIVTYTVAGAIVPVPEGGRLIRAGYHIGLRIALLPIVAGVAYEGLRLGASKDNALVRMLMKPGLWLQKITTKPPTADQIEVAIRAFEAVVPAAELDGRTAELPSPVVWGPEEAPIEGIGIPRPRLADG